MSKADLNLDWCSYAAAKYAVEHWHYSRKMPAGKLVTVGIWESGSFRGAMIFGSGTAPQASRPFAVSRFEVCELVRVALRGHISQVSRMVAIAIRLLKKQSPNLRLVVSYADPSAGHYGGIYQAGGWIYIGQSQPKWRANGIHNRAFGTSKARARARLGPDVAFTDDSPKHKYIYPLDAAMRSQLESLRKPYPKRAGSIASDAPAIQAGEGGPTPTSALSSSDPAP